MTQANCPFGDKGEVYVGMNPHKVGTGYCEKHGRFTLPNAKNAPDQASTGREGRLQTGAANPEAPADPEADAVAAEGNVATASGGGPSDEQAKAGPAVTSTLATGKNADGSKVTH